jgi:hypothetical protein
MSSLQHGWTLRSSPRNAGLGNQKREQMAKKLTSVQLTHKFYREVLENPTATIEERFRAAKALSSQAAASARASAALRTKKDKLIKAHQRIEELEKELESRPKPDEPEPEEQKPMIGIN